MFQVSGGYNPVVYAETVANATAIETIATPTCVLNCLQPYEEVADLEQLQERMVQSLGDYNARSRKPMDLVMFMFAVEHVSRLAR